MVDYLMSINIKLLADKIYQIQTTPKHNFINSNYNFVCDLFKIKSTTKNCIFTYFSTLQCK